MPRFVHLVSVLLVFIGITIADEASYGRVECVYSSYAATRGGNYTFRIEDIPIDYCTHIIYDNIEMDHVMIMMPSNPEYDYEQDGWEKFLNLKKINPKLKLLMSFKSALTSSHIETAEKRVEFINAIASFLTDYKFDGISIMWFGYWNSAGSEEGTIYKLFEELREKFVSLGHPEWEANLMTMIDVEKMDHGRMCKIVDSLSLLAVLDHVDKLNSTDVPCPLGDRFPNQNVSVQYSLQKWLNDGCPASKIALGFPLLGTTFVLSNHSNNELGAPMESRGHPCTVSRVMGACNYFELCQKFKETGWTFKWDEVGVSAYAFRGNQWIGYENADSLERKAKFAKSKGLAGVFGMSLDRDDYMGKCGERFPLTKALWKGFHE